MKKILALCLSFVLLFSLSTTAFAAEWWDESAGSGETTITGHIYSSYQISIPATIALEYEYTQCPVDSSIVLQRGNGVESIRGYLTNSEGYSVSNDNPLIVSFQQSDITNGDSTTKYFTMTYDKMGLPGDYSGIMQYSFCCEPISE